VVAVNRHTLPAFFALEALIMGANLLTGFALVRGMDRLQYAQYTLTVGLVSMMVNMSNMGLTPALSGIGGRFWSDAERLGALLATVLRLRRWIAAAITLPLLAYGAWQLHHIGTGPMAVTCLLAGATVMGLSQLEGGLYRVVSQLHQAVRLLQHIDWSTTLIRLVGTLGLLAVGAGAPWIIGWAALTYVLWSWRLRTLSGQFTRAGAAIDLETDRQVRDLVRPNALRTVYWTFESQISLLLCVWLASADGVAVFGALGRFALLFALLGAFTNHYLLPRLSRATDWPVVRRLALAVMALHLALALPLLLVGKVWPGALLWLLGSAYSGMEAYVFPFLVVSIIGTLAAAAYQVCAAKGWIHLNTYYPPLAIGGQILFIMLLKPKDLMGIIAFQGLSSLLFLLFNLVMFHREGKSAL